MEHEGKVLGTIYQYIDTSQGAKTTARLLEGLRKIERPQTAQETKEEMRRLRGVQKEDFFASIEDVKQKHPNARLEDIAKVDFLDEFLWNRKDDNGRYEIRSVKNTIKIHYPGEEPTYIAYLPATDKHRRWVTDFSNYKHVLTGEKATDPFWTAESGDLVSAYEDAYVKITLAKLSGETSLSYVENSADAGLVVAFPCSDREL